MGSLLYIVACSLLVLVVALSRFLLTPYHPPGTKLLPGPRGLPYIGIVPWLGTSSVWLKLTSWSHQYGPIYQTTLMGSKFVWLSDPKMCNDLLNKRQSIYSSRKQLPGIMHDNRNSMHYLALLTNGPDHKRSRRLGMHILSSTPRLRMAEACITQTKNLILALTSSGSFPAPDLPFSSTQPRQTKTFQEEVELACSATTCTLAWSDSTLPIAEKVVATSNAMIRKISPDGDIVNMFPFLRNVPSWVPLSWQPWKIQEMERVKREQTLNFGMQDKIRRELLADNHKWGLDNMERGMTKEGGEQNWMEKFYSMSTEQRNFSDQEGGFLIGFLAFVGSVLLSIPVQTFFVAMSEQPEWLRKGQEEVDRVCGSRMPTFDDIKELPTIRAIIRECFRWQTPIPVGVPHVLDEDDVYDGWFIERGSVVCALDWALSRDPKLYPNPDVFNPARWLDPAYPTFKSPLSIYPQVKAHPHFGWGRRQCIGQDYAEMVFITMVAGLLWSCDLGYKKNADGSIAERSTMGSKSVIVRPEGGDVEVRFREQWRRSVVAGQEAAGPVEEGVLASEKEDFVFAREQPVSEDVSGESPKKDEEILAVVTESSGP